MKKIILAAIGVILLVFVSGVCKKIIMPELSGFVSRDKAAALTTDEAKARALKFIENNLVQTGTKVEVKNITEENGLYKLDLDVSGQIIVAYMTKDGRKFFPNATDIAETEKKTAENKAADEEAEKNIPKSEKPVVDLYVMSFCPYGNKAEDTLKPVYFLLKNKRADT